MCSLASEYEPWLHNRGGSPYSLKGRYRAQGVPLQPKTSVEENKSRFGGEHVGTQYIQSSCLYFERRLKDSGYLAVQFFKYPRLLKVKDQGKRRASASSLRSQGEQRICQTRN